MSAVPAQRQTLTIVSGFLGSGKTTWLRHQLHAGEFRGAVVLVNEAAAAPVDDALLADLARVIVLPGGCACCDKRSEFLSLLAGLVDEKMRSGEAGGHIVLETSGLADPAALVEAIRSHPMLAHHIVVDEVIVTVDAGCGLANIRTNRLVAKQIEGADRVIVTKMDSVPSAACSALCATIARINPGARLSGAMNGEAMALPPFDPTTAVLPGHSHISEILAVGTADTSLTQPILDFVRTASEERKTPTSKIAARPTKRPSPAAAR